MPSERTLPVDAAHREFTVKVGGRAVPREHPLLAASLFSSANRVASARLVYADGVAAASDFPLANGTLFAPGAAVDVLAGSGTTPTLLFSGIVVRLRARVREQAAPQLIVDCRHAASRLAVARRSANHFDASDGEVVAQLCGDAGLAVDVQGPSVRHAQLVQHDVSDWDFIVARAQANGMLVLTRGAGLVLRRPSISGAASARLQFGATLLDFDAEADARIHPLAVHALSWNAAEQQLQHTEAGSPDFAFSGNLDPDELAAAAGAPRIALRHGVLAEAEAQALADAHWQRARVNQASGRAQCIGLPQVQPGDVVELAGVGARFSGEVMVTGVRHELDTVQGFRTHLQFGGVEPEPELLQRLARPRAAGLLATASGLQCGVVTDLEDPAAESRVRVRLPLVDAADDGLWARVASLDAGSDRGFQFRPEIGDEVVVGFLDDDPRHPVVLGMLHSSAKPAPMPASNDNHVKGYVSRSGMRLHFDDDQRILTLATPAGHALVLDDAAGALTLQDGHGNKIVLDASGIAIESAGALALKAATATTLEAQASLSIQAASDLKLEAAANAELKAGASVRLSGGTVQIN